MLIKEEKDLNIERVGLEKEEKELEGMDSK